MRLDCDRSEHQVVHFADVVKRKDELTTGTVAGLQQSDLKSDPVLIDFDLL